MLSQAAKKNRPKNCMKLSAVVRADIVWTGKKILTVEVAHNSRNWGRNNFRLISLLQSTSTKNASPKFTITVVQYNRHYFVLPMPKAYVAMNDYEAIKMMEVFISRGHNFDRTTPSPLDESSSGAVFEWGAYFFMCLFLLTDAYEFRNLVFRAPKLVIPGAPLYNAERMAPSPSPLPRRRELSFTDLPDSTLRVPLVL
ncbi:hypothetical protein TELCIR_07632 [Teladorsagia circumcincta]|uniref:Uncharacterized protein n=1 Tax=Teladorsagia circumcincta TaxID=45464 RepID=A0A2G9UJT6_TELCI|nr:hypothetical protein TELCIR_07632 [Teladorsagia circumcincta]